MSIKRVGFQKTSALYASRNTQLPMTGALCRFLATHFSTANNIQTELLKQYVYSDDHSKTEILIQPHYKWLTSIAQMRPALIVKRGPLSPKRIAITDGYTMDKDNGASKSVFVSGSHTIFCVSDQGGSAELLSEEVFQVLVEFAPLIRADFCLQGFFVGSLGEVSILEEFDEHFVVPIVVTWVKQNAWALRADGPWLQDAGTGSTIL